eukprot:CAMPEP_0113959874 /NCGR_PEP_ID=MMETSP0011_2-20120614/4393_1 /TAXON_ID=101924 /ORGANISM="Rhodosorus marinus" /LENGTH=664 /DNA_ID=CAMNT_0000971247 /DNA_START=160 /DNA_END=2151 /DNA_ORIENTATION=+ /assembly_acc=CAM_ASM_000156
MNILLYPAPNWYSSSCFDINYYGDSVAVATRNTVTFLETDNGGVIGELKIGGKERITSVRFNSALGLRHILATGSSNGQVRVWDADSRSEIRRLDPLKGYVIKSLEFPPTAPHVLLAGAASSRWKKGSLYSFSLDSDRPEKKELLEGVFETLSAPNERFFRGDGVRVAAATCSSSGYIVVFDVLTGGALASADLDSKSAVTAIEWSPDRNRLLTAQQNCVTVWRLSLENGSLDEMQRLEPSHQLSITKQGAATWTAALWISDTEIVSSTPEHSLAHFRLDELAIGASPEPFLSEDAHGASIFALKLLSSTDEHPTRIISVSMDRTMRSWRLGASGPQLDHTWSNFVAAYITCLDVSHDRNFVSVGVGDGQVCVLSREDRFGAPGASNSFAKRASLKLKKEHATRIQFCPADSGYSSKYALYLAAGTNLGNLYIVQLDLESDELEVASELWTHSTSPRSAVRSLQWERSRASGDDLIFCDGRLVSFNGTETADAPTGINRSTIAFQWTQDMHGSRAAVIESQTREVAVLDWPSLREIYRQPFNASCIDWMRNESTPVLVVGTEEGHVYAIEDLNLPAIADNGPCVRSWRIGGHTLGVRSVAWNRHDTELLLSVSADMTVQVWRIHDHAATPIANLRGHTGQIQVSTWFSQEQVLTGSSDHTLRVW